ncbi:sensor histidine kinase [Clostridiisalibacter paucivorans]|uniref:sensor histidine kinase n=1 Tax=Clostridiisalibacter paucivorans TaxID=408753 RepID=UPI001FE024C1|nr:ATP-binding protein [Clostridiisalibacter paucivorans]
MVTILGVRLNNKNRFISIRWKLVSTYLLLILIFVVIVNIFITRTLLNLYIEQKEKDTLINANILSNRVKFFLNADEGSSFFLRDVLKNQIDNFSKEIGSRIIVVDDKKVVKGDSNEKLINKRLNYEEIDIALSGDTKVNTYEFNDSGPMMYIGDPIMVDNKVVGATLVLTSLRDEYNRVREIRQAINMVSLVTMSIILIISYWFASIFSKPITRFTTAINKMAQGDLGQRVEINTNDEFSQLANAFNVMTIKLDQVDTQRKDFVANVSHELRTPLSSIKLLSESLLHQNETNVEIYRDFLEDIDSEIDRLNNIIDDLLMLVDLDKEKLTLNYKITYINFMLEKLISRLKPLADEKNISIKYIQKEKIQIKVDSEKLQQAIINIAHNAIKYTPEGGKIKISLYSKDKYVVIEIKDNGIGIPKESLPNIFERFYRVDKARTRNTGGTGLGLPIANQIISLHQGLIDVDSEMGKGTIFHIRIPYNM